MAARRTRSEIDRDNLEKARAQSGNVIAGYEQGLPIEVIARHYRLDKGAVRAVLYEAIKSAHPPKAFQVPHKEPEPEPIDLEEVPDFPLYNTGAPNPS